MFFFLFYIHTQSFESYKTNSPRRNYTIEVNRSSYSRMKTKSIKDSWYFVHFNTNPDFSLLSSHGIDIKPKNMISKLWYSLFLSSNQAQYLSTIASLRVVSNTEKIIDQSLIKFSESIEIETSSTFNPSTDLQKFDTFQLFVYKLDSNLYQLKSNDNQKLSNLLSYDEKVYSILPKNSTLFFNNRAAGFTQFNTNKVHLSGTSNDTIVIDRYLESKGLNGQGQVILVEDTYLDPNSTFFYDPENPLFEKNRYYSEHRKLLVIHEDYEYTTPSANEHGTHVAGCAAGSSHLRLNESNLPLFDGVAPQAKIAFYQSGSTGLYQSQSVENIVQKTNPCACTNSWGYRQSSMTDDNQWNKNAKEMNDTLFLFAAGNYGLKYNKINDYYETLISPGTGKNLLTVGALSSIPIEEQEDRFKSIFFFEVMSQQTYKPSVKLWSLNRGNNSIKNPGVDLLFSEGSVEMKMTKNVNENFNENDRILVINGEAEFLNISKNNPPLVVLTTVDFDIDNFESLGFIHLFPVLYLDNETVDIIYNSYHQIIEVETNYVDMNLTKIHRASYSSKGLSYIGLMKPEIVAPGTSYFSARSDPNGGFGHTDITIMDGTSMATPNVAGATALLSQYFTDKKYRSSSSIKPSSSLLRSMLINSADPLDENGVFPNAEVGFGSLNLGRFILTSVSEIGNDENVLVADHVEIIGDQQHLVAFVDIKDNERDFRVTLSYLDEVLNDDSSAALAIDLDLVVVGPDETVYRGNQRADETEEFYSTNERVIVKKNDVKPGKYEIHVFSHIPEIVPNKRSEFSVSIFGSISDSSSEMISFEKAKKCIPVVEKHGKCNNETTLNECKFDDYEGYFGHSCQNDVFILTESGKVLFELEPYGVKYVNVFYPFDAIFSNLSVSISSATNFLPKYAYTLNATRLKQLMREIDADNIVMDGDISFSILNNGQAVEWEPQSCLFSLVYNKSPKKTTFIVNYKINIAPQPEDPTETHSDIPTEKPSNLPTEIPSNLPTEIPSNLPTEIPSNLPTEIPSEISTESSNNEKADNENDFNNPYFISFIVAFVACLILFIVIVILAVIILKTRKAPQPAVDRSEMFTETLKTPLI